MACFHVHSLQNCIVAHAYYFIALVVPSWQPPQKCMAYLLEYTLKMKRGRELNSENFPLIYGPTEIILTADNSYTDSHTKKSKLSLLDT